jgi:tRNA-5-methyluridine54 2-sulfurtransferase
VRGIDYQVEECPMAVGNKHLAYKQALNSIEQGSPGSKAAFYLEFVDKMAPLLADIRTDHRARLVSCTSCGAPTTEPGSGDAPVCAFCRLRQRTQGVDPVPVEMVLNKRARKAYLTAQAAGGDR